MSIPDLSDPQTWSGNYQFRMTRRWHSENQVPRIPGTPEIILGYHRASKFRDCANNAQAFIDILGLAAQSRVLMIGAGFGWCTEALQQKLPGITAVSTDTSPWVQSVKGQTERSDIEAAMDVAGMTNPATRALWLSRFHDGGTRARVNIDNENLAASPSRNRMRSKAGITGNQKFDWAISENVLPWLDDAEALTLAGIMGQIASSVAHLVTPWLPKFADITEPPPSWNWKTIKDWKALVGGTIISVGDYRNV